MTTQQKVILYNLVLMQVIMNNPIPRGSGKSLISWDLLWRRKAFSQTEYCLAAIGETITDLAPEELYEN